MIDRKELEMLRKAVRYYQIHGCTFNGEEYKLCSQFLDSTFSLYYSQTQEQER
jgi:hypothetical protein